MDILHIIHDSSFARRPTASSNYVWAQTVFLTHLRANTLTYGALIRRLTQQNIVVNSSDLERLLLMENFPVAAIVDYLAEDDLDHDVDGLLLGALEKMVQKPSMGASIRALVEAKPTLKTHLEDLVQKSRIVLSQVKHNHEVTWWASPLSSSYRPNAHGSEDYVYDMSAHAEPPGTFRVMLNASYSC
jgi:hypothetical protein